LNPFPSKHQQAIDLLRAWVTRSATNYQDYADWQLSHFGSTNRPGSAPGEDPDSDDASNELEYLTGSNPLLASDGWGIEIAKAGANAEIHFSRIASRGFQVQWSTNLSAPSSWQPLEVPNNQPVYAITNYVVKVQDAVTNAPSKFYRVSIREP
jgi:hypothetical protein